MACLAARFPWAPAPGFVPKTSPNHYICRTFASSGLPAPVAERFPCTSANIQHATRHRESGGFPGEWGMLPETWKATLVSNLACRTLPGIRRIPGSVRHAGLLIEPPLCNLRFSRRAARQCSPFYKSNNTNRIQREQLRMPPEVFQTRFSLHQAYLNVGLQSACHTPPRIRRIRGGVGHAAQTLECNIFGLTSMPNTSRNPEDSWECSAC